MSRGHPAGGCPIFGQLIDPSACASSRNYIENSEAILQPWPWSRRTAGRGLQPRSPYRVFDRPGASPQARLAAVQILSRTNLPEAAEALVQVAIREPDLRPHLLGMGDWQQHPLSGGPPRQARMPLGHSNSSRHWHAQAAQCLAELLWSENNRLRVVAALHLAGMLSRPVAEAALALPASDAATADLRSYRLDPGSPSSDPNSFAYRGRPHRFSLKVAPPDELPVSATGIDGSPAGDSAFCVGDLNETWPKPWSLVPAGSKVAGKLGRVGFQRVHRELDPRRRYAFTGLSPDQKLEVLSRLEQRWPRPLPSPTIGAICTIHSTIRSSKACKELASRLGFCSWLSRVCSLAQSLSLQSPRPEPSWFYVGVSGLLFILVGFTGFFRSAWGAANTLKELARMSGPAILVAAILFKVSFFGVLGLGIVLGLFIWNVLERARSRFIFVTGSKRTFVLAAGSYWQYACSSLTTDLTSGSSFLQDNGF